MEVNDGPRCSMGGRPHIAFEKLQNHAREKGFVTYFLARQTQFASRILSEIRFSNLTEFSTRNVSRKCHHVA